MPGHPDGSGIWLLSKSTACPPWRPGAGPDPCQIFLHALDTHRQGLAEGNAGSGIESAGKQQRQAGPLQGAKHELQQFQVAVKTAVAQSLIMDPVGDACCGWLFSGRDGIGAGGRGSFPAWRAGHGPPDARSVKSQRPQPWQPWFRQSGVYSCCRALAYSCFKKRAIHAAVQMFPGQHLVQGSPPQVLLQSRYRTETLPVATARD
jgi:hypothetical protein